VASGLRPVCPRRQRRFRSQERCSLDYAAKAGRCIAFFNGRVASDGPFTGQVGVELAEVADEKAAAET